MGEQSRGDAGARLRRIAGQVAGLQRMLAEDRYCGRAALAEVGRVVLAHHDEACLTEAPKSAGKAEQRFKLDELMETFSRYCALGTRPRSKSKTD
jgi:DNA-binding FrmR family transcriptional regulator